jgi:hypothetical protein
LEECQGCHKRITEGRILHATGSDNLKRSFHTDCFRCGLSVRDRTADAQPASPANEQPAATDGDIDDRPRGCQAPLQLDQNEGVEAIHTKYFIQNDLVYCQECYDLHFLPQCGECGERIKNLDANGKIRFYTHEGKPYCIECYEMSFVPECGLNEYDIDKFVVVSGDKYHKSCFNCYDCGQSFDQLKAYMWKNKQFYCREHYDKVAAAAVS